MWLERVAKRIIALLPVYVGLAHDLAVELLLFDSLVSIR